MKKFVFKFCKSFAFAGALVLAAMLQAGSANAQIQANDLEFITNWVPVDQAITTLNQEIADMDLTLQNGPNEPLDYKRKFYNGIVISLEQGETVYAALNGNYVKFVPGLIDQAPVEIPNPLSAAVWKNYYDEVVVLLKD